MVAAVYLEGPYRGQVNEGIQTVYDERFCRKSWSETPAVYDRRRRVRQGGG
jgi:hypothetical protein